MAKKTYEVTIGIPVYNVERYIRQTMESALAQTYPDIEFLVLDDCGTDGSMEIVRRYMLTHRRGRDIRIVRQQRNGGIGPARNRIIDEASGRYLYFLDADDTIAPQTIALLHQQAARYEADIVFASYETIEEFDGQTRRTPYRYPACRFMRPNEFADRAFSDYGFLQASTCNFLIRRDILLENHLRLQPVGYWEDFAFTIDLPTYVTRAILLPDITYHYYCRYGSLSRFGEREHIDKAEIQEIATAMGHVKQNTDRLRQKPYLHKRMYKVMLTHFFMACTILKERRKITPPFSDREIRDLMRSPLSLAATLRLPGWRLRNLALAALGVLPPPLSVALIWLAGKCKGLI